MKRRLSDYREFVDESKISEIYRKATKLSKYHILHINSTYYSGGVAEILRNIVPLLNEIGIDTGWRAIIGSPDYFRVCKKFHNGLLGEDINLTDMKKQVFEEASEEFASFTHVKGHDLVIVHNHEPLPLINFYKKRQPWIWRCHEDLSNPNPEVFDYLKSFIIPFDEYVFQMGECAVEEFQEVCRFIQPSIDPLSTKNQMLEEEMINKYLNKIGVDTSRPIISQVTHFDKYKDPNGLIEVFKRVRKEMDCQLVLIGDIAREDPEGQKIYEQVSKKAENLEDVYLVIDPHDIVVNVVQRASDVVLLKSLKEGFGLSVSEALWKGTPVVGSNLAGIASQIIDGETGYLVEPLDYNEVAKKVMDILSDEKLKEEMGKKGKERVRKNFLITRQIEDSLNQLSEFLL